MTFDLRCNLPYTRYNNFALRNPIFKNTLTINNELKTCYMRSSSSFDYGWKIGKHYRFQYHIIDLLARYFKQIKIDERVVEDHLNKVSDFSPSTLNEFKGLSASTHIKLERLVYLHILFSYMLGSRCTSMLATGKATKENSTFLFMNLDGGIFLTTLVRMFALHIWTTKRKNSKEYRYAFIGIPIIFENPLINEKGLGLGQTSTICSKEGYNKNMDREGVFINSFIRTTMKSCKNVYEVAELWKNTKISCHQVVDEINQTTAWCDGKEGILMIEVGPDQIATVFGNSTDITGTKEGILWHTLHHQWLDGRKTGSILPSENIVSALRANRAKELLEMNYGDISLETCKMILRDHGKEEHDGLCRHPKKKLVFTAASYIVEPKKLTVYLASGNPCKSKFRKHDFTKLFSK